MFRKSTRYAVAVAVMSLSSGAWAFGELFQSATAVLQTAQSLQQGAPATVVANLAMCGKDKKTPCPAMASGIAFSRAPDQLDKLLTGNEISGDQLLTEMKALRGAVASQNLNAAMQSLLGPVSAVATGQAPAASGGFFGGGFLSSLSGAATDVLLDMLVAELSYQSLDFFFSTLTDKPGLLKEVKIKLPKADATMTPEMKQQLVTLGSFLVAIKGSGKIIDASEADFEAAKESYRKVLDSRTMAAKLLGEAFYARAQIFAAQAEGKARGQTYLSKDQMEYLESFRDKKQEDFMRDFTAQNIALEYLKKTNPKEFGDYRVQVDNFKSHYGAYARTTVGAASMLGFSSIFLKRAKNMVEKNGLVGAPALLPMVGDGLSELISLAPRISKTLERSPDSQDGSFALKLPNNDIKRELTAAKVFSTLNDESRGEFQKALFKDGQPGYFGALGEKYPQIAGRILDGLVDKDNRKLFVKGYLQVDDMPDFSFQNALSDKAKKTRELKMALFRSAPPDTANAEDQKAVAIVQKDVREKLSKWDNSALRRIMIANNQPKQPNLELALNGYTLTIDSPGMKGILEYEEMAASGASHATTRTVEGQRGNGKSKGAKK